MVFSVFAVLSVFTVLSVSRDDQHQGVSREPHLIIGASERGGAKEKTTTKTKTKTKSIHMIIGPSERGVEACKR